MESFNFGPEARASRLDAERRRDRRVQQNALLGFARARESGSFADLDEAINVALRGGDADTARWIQQYGSRELSGRPKQPNAFAPGAPQTPQPPAPVAAPMSPSPVAPTPAPVAPGPFDAPTDEAKPENAGKSDAPLRGIAPPSFPPLNAAIASTALGADGRSRWRWSPERRVWEPADAPSTYNAATGTAMLENNLNGLIAEDNALTATPEQAALTSAPAAAATAGQDEVGHIDYNLDDRAIKAAPQHISQRYQQLRTQESILRQRGELEQAEILSGQATEELETIHTLYRMRLNFTRSIIPALRALPSDQRLAAARDMLQQTPYAYDADGNPIRADDVLPLLEQMGPDISDDELRAVQRVTDRQSGEEADREDLSNADRRTIPYQYRREQRELEDNLGILRTSIPYARAVRAAPSGSGPQGWTTTSVRGADVALLRAAARAQTGPGVLTESEVFQTLSPSLQNEIRRNGAYFNEGLVALSEEARRGLADFVMQAARGAERAQWDTYEAYVASWGSENITSVGIKPPRTPHPDDEPVLAAALRSNPRQGQEVTANDGRVYNYVGRGEFEFSHANGGEPSFAADSASAEPTAQQPTPLSAAVSSDLRGQPTPAARLERARALWARAPGQPQRDALTAAFRSAVQEGLLSAADVASITGRQQ